MALEEILQAKKKLGAIDGIMKRAKEGDYTAPFELGALAHKEDNHFPANFYADKTLFDVNQSVRALAEQYQTELVDKVKQNYTEVLGSLDEKALVSLALSVKPSGDDSKAVKHRRFLEEQKKLKAGNLEAYIGGLTSPAVKQIVQYHLAINPERISGAYESYVKSLQGEFLQEFASGDRRALNIGEVRDYLIRNTEALKDEEKSDVYFNAGLMVKPAEQEKAAA